MTSNLREIAALAPLLLLIVVLGFFPKPLLDVINPSVDHTMTQVEQDRPADPPVTEGEARPRDTRVRRSAHRVLPASRRS